MTKKYFKKFIEETYKISSGDKVFTTYLCRWENERIAKIREILTNEINKFRRQNNLDIITRYFFEYNINFWNNRDKLIEKCVEYCTKKIKKQEFIMKG